MDEPTKYTGINKIFKLNFLQTLRHRKRVYYIENKQPEEFIMKPTEEIPEEDD